MCQTGCADALMRRGVRCVRFRVGKAHLRLDDLHSALTAFLTAIDVHGRVRCGRPRLARRSGSWPAHQSRYSRWGAGIAEMLGASLKIAKDVSHPESMLVLKFVHSPQAIDSCRDSRDRQRVRSDFHGCVGQSVAGIGTMCAGEHKTVARFKRP